MGAHWMLGLLLATSPVMAGPPAEPQAACDALMNAVVDQVAGDIETAALAQWFRDHQPEAKEDPADPEEATFVMPGCRFQFTKRMSLGHGVHVRLDPARPVRALLEHTSCTSSPVREGFEYDGIGHTGRYYAVCDRTRHDVQFDLVGGDHTVGTHDLRPASVHHVWIQRTL